MAKNATFGYTPSSDKLAFQRDKIDFAKDFTVASKTDHRTVITNLSSPLDQPETIRWEYSPISDIYKGTSIDPKVRSASSKGASIVTQINEVMRITDDTDPSFQVDLPWSCHIVLKVPHSSYVKAVDAQSLVARLLSTLYESGSITTSRLEALLRGSMTPSDM